MRCTARPPTRSASKASNRFGLCGWRVPPAIRLSCRVVARNLGGPVWAAFLLGPLNRKFATNHHAVTRVSSGLATTRHSLLLVCNSKLLRRSPAISNSPTDQPSPFARPQMVREVASKTSDQAGGHRNDADPCPLLGVKRTSRGHALMSVFDPKRTWRPAGLRLLLD